MTIFLGILVDTFDIYICTLSEQLSQRKQNKTSSSEVRTLLKFKSMIILPAKQTRFISKLKKKTDVQDVEKLFTEPQSLPGVIDLNLYCKLKKINTKNKKNKKTKKEINAAMF